MNIGRKNVFDSQCKKENNKKCHTNALNFWNI